MTDSYRSPEWILNLVKDFYDPCPFNENPIIDGLKEEWKEKTYINPPYSNPLPWIEKAIEEHKKGKYIVMLLKCDPSTKVYRLLHENKAHILLLNERLKYGVEGTAPFPSMLVIL